MICKRCGEDKEESEFEKTHSAHGEGRRGTCRKCLTTNRRRSWLNVHYNMTPEEFEELFDSQGGVCAICKKPSSETLAVDHDHITNKNRGLLCTRCNRALGLLNEDPNTFEEAASYLRKWSK